MPPLRAGQKAPDQNIKNDPEPVQRCNAKEPADKKITDRPRLLPDVFGKHVKNGEGADHKEQEHARYTTVGKGP
jgi:hypothetical protein